MHTLRKLRAKWLSRPYARRLYKAYCAGFVPERKLKLRSYFWPRWS